MSRKFFNIALFCGGNMFFWGRYRRNQGLVGGDGDASPENRESSTKEKPRRVDPPLTERDHDATESGNGTPDDGGMLIRESEIPIEL